MFSRTAIALLMIPAAVFADSITFRNGGQIEGVITGETATELTIKTGPGSATFKKSELRSIFRDPNANAGLKQEWQSNYFATPEFLPPEIRPLAQMFRELLAKRDAATRAQKEIPRQQDEDSRLDADMRALYDRQLATAAKLQKMKPAENPSAYNEVVRENNDLVSRFTLMRDRRQKIESLTKTNRVAIAAYLGALGSFRDAFESARARPATNEQARIFFAKAGEQLAALNSAVQELHIPIADPVSGQAIVTVRINDAGDARMLVDTGASFVTLSSAAAVRMKLKPDRAEKVTVSLANGAEIKVRPVTLASVRVAGATIANVPAVILPDPPGDNIDGLLGMSFLREFDLQYDTARGQILLRRLPAK